MANILQDTVIAPPMYSIANRFDHLDARIVAASPAVPALGLLEQLHYEMDNVHTGDLFLSWGPSHKVSWTSATTGLTTRWHGAWTYHTGKMLHVDFDYLGMDNDKWTQVNSDGEGRDYRGRHIRVRHVKFRNFDSDAFKY